MTERSTASTRGRWRSRLLQVAALIVVLLGVAELGVRAVDGRLLRPLEWHQWEAQVKADQIETLSTKGGAPIVIIGNSAMHYAFDPGRFAADLPQAPIAYNAGLPGGIPKIMQVWTERLVIPKLHPKVVVLGVVSADLNDAGTQEYFYKVFADSQAARRLMGVSSTFERIDHELSSWSAVWRFRPFIRRPVTFVQSLRGNRPRTPADTIGPLGVDPSRWNRTVDASPAKVQGFIAFRRTNWLRNYATGGSESAALRKLVEDVRALGVTVVLVEMPVGSYYVDAHPNGLQDYEKYEQEIATLAADTGSVLLDASRSVAPTPDYFSDFTHLNGKGTRAFTDYLARELQRLGLA